MEKKYLIIVIISSIVLIVGCGLSFCENTLVYNIGIGIRLIGFLLLAVIYILIFIDKYRKEKKQSENLNDKSLGAKKKKDEDDEK